MGRFSTFRNWGISSCLFLSRKKQSRAFQKYMALYEYIPRGRDGMGIKEEEIIYFLEKG